MTSGQAALSKNKCGGRSICPQHQAAFAADQKGAAA
jgi:hypothetical protein